LRANAAASLVTPQAAEPSSVVDGFQTRARWVEPTH